MEAARTSSRAAPISEDVWEQYRGVISHLYRQHKLAEVMEEMKKEYGFEATVKQYKGRITKWKLDKNVKSHEMNSLLQRPLREQYDIRGRTVGNAKIRRYVRRKIGGPALNALLARLDGGTASATPSENNSSVPSSAASLRTRSESEATPEAVCPPAPRLKDRPAFAQRGGLLKRALVLERIVSMIRRNRHDILSSIRGDIVEYAKFDAWRLSKIMDDLQRLPSESSLILVAIIYMSRFSRSADLRDVIVKERVQEVGLLCFLLGLKLAQNYLDDECIDWKSFLHDWDSPAVLGFGKKVLLDCERALLSSRCNLLFVPPEEWEKWRKGLYVVDDSLYNVEHSLYTVFCDGNLMPERT